MKRFFQRVLSSCLILLLAFSLVSCKTETKESTDKLSVVATNFPAYDFARQIAKDMAEITMLLPPGTESHTYEPSPKDIIKIKEADLFIMGGGQSDEWAKRLISSSSLDEDKVLSMMDCVVLAKDTHDTHDHSSFYEYDEHVWTAPENAMAICAKITARLTKADSKNKSFYEARHSEYQDALIKLDKSFQEVVNTASRKTLVFGDRFAFRYFANQYGLSYFAAFPGCSDQTEPDAGTMKFLIDKVKSDAIPVVLYGELSNQAVADAICEATGAKKALLHSCHTITKEEFTNGETYLSIMQKNVNVLKEALF